MKLNEILGAVRKQVAAEHKASRYYDNAEDKAEFIDLVIADMTVLELLQILSRIEEPK